ncbi:MAG: type I-MYXAN CRISPR-associated protein Cas6/Cmx6 [Pyrinomonadaceae bacterium]
MNDSSASAISRSNQPLPELIQSACINVSFALSGKLLPADHGYLIYSAISRAFPALHGVDWLGIELISGFPSAPGLINLHFPDNSKLGTQNSKLSLRIPADHYRDVLPLAGKRLDIGGHQIRLGLPVARPLEPAPSLYARVVTIKKFTEPEPFLEAVNRQLDSLHVKGTAELPLDVAQTVSSRSDNLELGTQNSKLQFRYRRRIVTIHGKSVVGFSVAVHDLNDDDSLKLQSIGIGGRHAMGCGIFNHYLKQYHAKLIDKVFAAREGIK